METSSAFAQLSRLRLRDHSMESALREVAELAKAVVPGASEVSVSLVSRQRSDTVVHTGDLALDLDESQYERGYGPCLDAANDGMIMHVEDMATETRWGDYTREAIERGALSSMSVPVMLHEERRITAALNIYSRSVHAFDSEALRTAASLAGYAETVLANMHEHDSSRELVQQLAQALETRPVIDQAKGILMRDRSCTSDEAFELLVAASQRSNRKLRDIARDVVDSVGKPRGPAK
ncbi:MAG TPA: ANTAR domain-containing protein [Nocardioidaceae bacterium]|nr:ANTAR domain-containing protein [Nocardioidaceae bacterium]